MGYIDETSTGPFTYYEGSQKGPNATPTKWGGINYPAYAKEQFGYRSGPLSEEERKALFEYEKTNNWGQTRTSVSHLERIMRANNDGSGGSPNLFGVNDRIYLQTDFNPCHVTITGDYKPGSQWSNGWTWIGSLGLDSLAQTQIDNHPPEIDIRAEGAKLIRNSRPTKPAFDLTRFVGELKDANMLFNVPKPGSQGLGGAYLNAQFGWSPTVSDVKRGAEAILAADQKYVKFLEESLSIQQVRRTSFLGHKEWTGVFNAPAWSSGMQYPRSYTITNLGTVAYHCPMTAASMRPFGFEWRIGTTEEVKAFAQYQWFIYDPEEFSLRRNTYLEKARKVLGGGLTVSTMYELFPFSWMVDWFYDIGGLLAYQQDVADYSLVARRMGVSYNRKFFVSLRSTNPGTGSSFRNGKASGVAYATGRQNLRYPGNPYDLSTSSWDDILSDPYKAAILAALGLTKAKNIPFKR